MGIVEPKPKGPPRITALDPAKVQARRIVVGLSLQDLAYAVAGTSTEAIARLERDGDQGQYTLAFVATLADALGVSIGELLVDEARPEAVDQPDAAVVGALLATATGWSPLDHVAAALRWPLDRTIAAVTELDVALGACGQRIARAGDAVRVVADAAGAQALPELGRNNVTFIGLRENEALLVSAILSGGTRGRPKARAIVAGHLVGAGVIEAAPRGATDTYERLQLTDEARFNLCLPPR